MIKLLKSRGLLSWADIAFPTGGSREGPEFEIYGVSRGSGIGTGKSCKVSHGGSGPGNIRFVLNFKGFRGTIWDVRKGFEWDPWSHLFAISQILA